MKLKGLMSGVGLLVVLAVATGCGPGLGHHGIWAKSAQPMTKAAERGPLTLDTSDPWAATPKPVLDKEDPWSSETPASAKAKDAKEKDAKESAEPEPTPAAN
jgi:hypothetical protein